MFKFGANHMFRGANTLRNLDIGNMLSELAASHGTKSLHVLALEAKGKQAAFGGIGKPSMVVDAEAGKDDFPELKPLFELADANASAGWSLFDMRVIRGSYKKLGLAPELDRVAVGYDLVVIIPVSTASSDVGLTLKP